jgi:carboxylesterase type B
MLSSLLLPLLAIQALAVPVDHANSQTAKLEERAAPSVTITNGTVTGSTSGGVDSFVGIPFAQPPTGSLRLKPPQPLTTGFGTISATGIAPACPQFYFTTGEIPDAIVGDLLDLPLFQWVQNESEDCLTIDVRRPSGTKASAKLPVLVYIFGGGFELGSTQLYDGTNIVQKSVSKDKDIIYVAMNYRTGGFGFLGGKEIKADGASNLGLKDQRLALQWVQENIAAFGGDPEKVTIWGESAGSISVYDHTIINGGDHNYNGKPLFRAGIMDSGCAVPTQDVDSDTAQAIYDGVVDEAGCSSASDTLACLRDVDYSTLLNAANSVPGILGNYPDIDPFSIQRLTVFSGYRSVDLSYLPRPDDSDNFFPVSPEAATNIADVPVIIGDQEDEGTLFALFQSNITTTEELVDYLYTYFPTTTREVVAGLVDTYSTDPADGSPFRTGDLYQLYPQFKRLAAILGDATFTLNRRLYLDIITANGITAYSYLATYLHGTPIVGTVHGSDILALFFNLNLPIWPSNSILNYYIAFVNDLDPNTAESIYTLTEWPKYDSDSREILSFGALTTTKDVDDFRSESAEYLRQNQAAFKV